jgi:hypothetical protein
LPGVEGSEPRDAGFYHIGRGRLMNPQTRTSALDGKGFAIPALVSWRWKNHFPFSAPGNYYLDY